MANGLKKVEAFLDENGKLWKTEEAYNDELEKLRKASEERIRQELIRDIVAAVYGPAGTALTPLPNGILWGGGDLNHQGLSTFQWFLNKMSIEELRSISMVFFKHRQQINAFKTV